MLVVAGALVADLIGRYDDDRRVRTLEPPPSPRFREDALSGERLACTTNKQTND